MTFINICMSLPLQVVNDFSVEAPGSSNEEMLPVHELWPESKADPVRKRVTSSRSQGFQLDSNYWDTKLFNMTWKENKASQSWRGTRNLRVRKGFRNHGVQNPPCTDEGSVAESPREHPGHGTHFCLRFPGVAVSMSFRTHVGLVYQLPLPSRRLTVFSSSLRLKGDIPQHPIPFSSPPPLLCAQQIKLPALLMPRAHLQSVPLYALRLHILWCNGLPSLGSLPNFGSDI